MSLDIVVIQPLVALIRRHPDPADPASVKLRRRYLPDPDRHHRAVAAVDIPRSALNEGGRQS